MYPVFSREEVWDICLRLLERDTPLSDAGKSLSAVQADFDAVYEQVREEHAHIRNKYYRDKTGMPVVNPLYVEHYARLMYYFSRRLFLKQADRYILDLIILSIKCRCCIDLFYEFDLKPYFLAFHPYGTVLGRARYSDHLVVLQHCTIGNNRGRYPTIGKGFILWPGATVLGHCNIGDNVQVAAVALIVDRDIPSNSVVTGRVPDLTIRENREDNIGIFFD